MIIKQVHSIMQDSVSEDRSASQESQKSKKNSLYHKKLRKNKSKGSKSSKPKDQQSQPTDNSLGTSVIRSAAALRVFDSQCAKFQRLQSFFKEDIFHYYPNVFSPKQVQNVQRVLADDHYGLQQVLENKKNLLNTGFPMDQLMEYVDLVGKQSLNTDMVVVSNGHKNVLISTQGKINLHVNFLTDISAQQARVLKSREKVMDYYNHQIQKHQALQNRMNGTNQNDNKKVSQITRQIITLDHLYCQNRVFLRNTLSEKIEQAKTLNLQQYDIQQRYVTFLIKKNLKFGVSYIESDILNFYRISDSIQEPQSAEIKPIQNKKELQQYIKKKKAKKIRKFRPAILKSACLGCLSYKYQQYNQLYYCFECQARFHKLCYTPNLQGLCQNCQIKKQNPTNSNIKIKVNQCIICNQKGFLYRKIDQDQNIHIFCMLANNLWCLDTKLKLKFDEEKYKATYEKCKENKQFQKCVLCQKNGQSSFMFNCSSLGCTSFVHSTCAYLNGWEMKWSENDKLIVKCCPDIDLKDNAHRRKFILNYKKYAYNPSSLN